VKGADVVVVGSGVIGSATAYHLARSGVDVVLCDRAHPPAGGTASGASAGGVRQQNRVGPELALALRSIALWADLEAELGADVHYRREGMAICIDDARLLGALRNRIDGERALGLDVRLASGEELRALVPDLSPAIVAGSYCPSDGHADPIRTTEAFARAAAGRGARILRDTPVIDLLSAGGRVEAALTPSGPLPCGAVVLAAGPWTPALLRRLGADLPIRPGCLQMQATVPMPARLRPVLGWVGHGISLKQVPGGAYVIGGGWPGAGEPERYQADVLPASMRKSAAVVVGLLPVLAGVPVARAWVGWESFSVDDLPVIGPLAGIDGAWVAAGFSGHGFALAPAVGEQVAQAVQAGRPTELLQPFAPSRFGEEGSR
jgi:sarcosine oxidase subunit beta